MRYVHPRCVAVWATIVVFLAAASASGGPIWDGGDGTDPSLGTASNWNPDGVPLATDDVQFDGSTNTSPDTGGAGRTYKSIAFNTGASAFTLGGTDTISVTATLAGTTYPPYPATIVNNSTATQTFNAPVALTGTASNAGIQAVSGDLVFGNVSFSNAGTTRVYAPGHTVTINGNISSVGTGSINHYEGTLVLNADNRTTWTRKMGVNLNGVLRLAATGAAGDYITTDTNHQLLVQGGSGHAGTLELVNNITIEKWIVMYFRTNADNAHIRSTGDNTINGKITTSSGGSYMNVDSMSGLLTLGCTIDQSVTGTQLIRFRGDGNTKLTNTLSGTAPKTWKVAKLGGGILTYDSAGVNYSGDTAVFGGKLALTIAGASALANSTKISVQSGAELDVSAVDPDVIDLDFTLAATQTLRGKGMVTGNIATAASSTLAPGGTVDDLLTTYGDSAGTLSVAGGLVLGGNMNWDLAALSTSSPGTNFDTLSVSGDLSLAGTSQLVLNFNVLDSSLRPDAATPDAFWSAPHAWKIVDAGTNSSNTNFAGIAPVTTPAGWSFTTSVGTGADAGDIFLNYVPEPSAASLLILAAVGCLVHGWRGRQA